MPKIALINQPIGNRGDQAAHRALLSLLQEHPSLETTVLSLCAPQAIRQFAGAAPGVRYVTIPRFRKQKKLVRRAMYLPAFARKFLTWTPEVRQYNTVLRESDYVLCAPGGICMGAYRNWQHVWELANALALGKRTGIFGRSIGPFDGNRRADVVFRRRSVEILRRVDFLSLRDSFSQQIARELGVPYVPTLDTVYACQPEAELPEELRFLRNRQYVVLVPNQLSAWHPFFQDLPPERFEQLYLSILREILALGLNVVMVPHLFDPQSDRPYFVRLAKGFEQTQVTVLPATYDSDVQQQVVRASRLVIGARAHAIVFAINNARPFLCLSYEHKMLYMLKDLGLEEYALLLKDLLTQDTGVEQVKEQMKTILREEGRIAPKIEQARQTAADSVRRSFACFLARL